MLLCYYTVRNGINNGSFMARGTGKWLQRHKERQAGLEVRKPTIGIVYSPTSPDPNETKFLPGTQRVFDWLGADKVNLDFREETAAFNRHRKIQEGICHEASELPAADVAFRRYIEQRLDDLKIDGVVLPSDYYNQVAPGINPSSCRNQFQSAICDIAEKKGIPLLGICGGEQFVLKRAGAEITPEIKQRSGSEHWGYGVRNMVHNISVVSYSILAGAVRLAGDKDYGSSLAMKVNSEHTQAGENNERTRKNLAKNGLHITGVDPSGKLIEAAENMWGAPQMLMQCHPEYLLRTEASGQREDAMQRYMQAFVDAACAYAHKRAVVSKVASPGRSFAGFVPCYKAEARKGDPADEGFFDAVSGSPGGGVGRA